jgi:hypothetical protein
MKKRLTVLLGILWMGIAFGQENVVVDTTVLNSRLDTNAQTVGGMITQKVEWRADADLELLPADSSNALLLVSATFDSTALTRTATFTYLVLDTGALVLPALSAVSLKGIYTVIPDTVQSRFLPAEEGIDNAAARPLAEVPFNFIWWLEAYWHWIALGGALLLMGYLVWRYAKKPEASPVQEPEPERDYYKEAMDAIATLRADALWERDMKGFYVALGDVVRTYLTHRTGLPLSEQTTSESVRMLYQKWTAAQIESYQFILTRADYVKFAKGSWDVAVHRDCLDKATALITDFKPEQDV